MVTSGEQRKRLCCLKLTHNLGQVETWKRTGTGTGTESRNGNGKRERERKSTILCTTDYAPTQAFLAQFYLTAKARPACSLA